MKTVKLLLIAIVVVGAVAGLLLLSNGSSNTGSNGRDDKLFDRLEAELSEQWNEAEEWDIELLDASLDRLYQNEDRLGSGYQVLVDMVANDACNLLHESMMGEFARSACSKAKIEQYNKDLKYFLSKTTGYARHDKVKKMQETYSLYNNILSLIQKSKNTNVAPNFNFDNGTWSDFNAYQRGIINQRDSYRSNVYFEYLSNITELTTGLNQIQDNLAKAKTNFKNALAKQIIDAFNSREHSSEYYTKLSYLNRTFIETFGTQQDLRDYTLHYND